MGSCCLVKTSSTKPVSRFLLGLVKTDYKVDFDFSILYNIVAGISTGDCHSKM